MKLKVVDMIEVKGGPCGSSISFTILGTPPAQPRHKIRFRGRFKPYAYDPSGSDKTKFRNHLRATMKEFNMLLEKGTYFDERVALELHLYFCLPWPKMDLKRTPSGELVLRDHHSTWPRKKDIDNLIKWMMDSFQSVIYKDDCCVVEVHVSKFFPSGDDLENEGFTGVRVQPAYE